MSLQTGAGPVSNVLWPWSENPDVSGGFWPVETNKKQPTFAAPIHVLWGMEPRADLSLVDWRLLGKSSSLFEWEREMDDDKFTYQVHQISERQLKKVFPSNKHCNNLLFSESHWGRGRTRRRGGRGASHGDTWQSRSADTRGDAGVLTPTPQTAPEISPGCHKVKLGAATWRKVQWPCLYEADTGNIRKNTCRCWDKWVLAHIH